MKRINNYIKYIILFSILIAQTTCADKTEKTEIRIPQNSIGIIITRNTAMRIDPFIFSIRITLLEKGDTIVIIERSSEKSWIGKSLDYWYKAKIKNGITGWIFGKNIKHILSKDQEALTEYVSEFMENESDKLIKEIAGKWWSINRFGDFTNHCIEIYHNGKYKSYRRGKNVKIIEGDLNFNYNKNEIVFLKGTSFESNLNFIKRGNSFILKKELKNGELKFKQILKDTTFQPGVKKNESQIK